MLSRELGISNKGWPSLKGCKLISKSHPRHAQEHSQICCKNNHRDFSNCCTSTLGTQWMKLTPGASPAQHTVPLMHRCVLKGP